MAPPKPTHYIVTANRLVDGHPVYLRSDSGWTRTLGEAWLIEDKAEAERRVQEAVKQDTVVCDPYLFGVRSTEQGLDPLSARERIRSVGPSTRLRRPDRAGQASGAAR